MVPPAKNLYTVFGVLDPLPRITENMTVGKAQNSDINDNNNPLFFYGKIPRILLAETSRLIATI